MRNKNVPRAAFAYDVYELMGDKILAITDLDKGKSVTNDIAQVLDDISRAQGHSLAGYQVMYRDSLGVWDGVELTKEGKFSRFFALQEVDEIRAFEKLRSKAAVDAK